MWPATLLVAIGCGPVTEVVIRVDAEPGAKGRGQFLEAVIVNGEGTTVRNGMPALSVRDGGTSLLPISFGLIPEISSRFTFTARLLDADRAAFAEVRHEGQYTDGEVEFVNLLFEDQVARVSAGHTHTCAIRQGRLWCFGGNRSGEAGVDSSSDTIDTPTLVPGLWREVSAGDGSTCALDQADALYCWGDVTGLVSSSVPVAIEPMVRFSDVSVSDNLVCAVSRDGLLSCWGSDSFHRLGIDPVTGPPLRSEQVAQVSTSGVHVCGVTRAGALHCWGGDSAATGGTNGAEERVDTRTYSSLAIGSGYTATISSYGTTCAIEDSGALYCFGLNSRGMLADAGPVDGQVSSPSRVGTRSDWSDVCLGICHACGVHADGALDCWGCNNSGQLGVGADDFDSRLEPTVVQGGRLWASVDCGDFFTCGTTQEGTVYCWGIADGSVLGQDYPSMGLRRVGQPLEVPLPP